MKNRGIRLLLGLLLVSVALSPLSAMAYYDVEKDEFYEGEAPTFVGTLNHKIATRTGPSTAFEEPGTFFKAGDCVQVISLSYDTDNVAWVQVDFWDGNLHYRAYTGLHRFSDLCESVLPLEVAGAYPPGTLTRDVKPKFGPGDDYVTYSFTLKKDRVFEVLEIEGDWAMIQFYAQYDQQWNRCWVPLDALW